MFAGSTCLELILLQKGSQTLQIALEREGVSLTAVSAKGFALWKPTIFWKKLSKTFVLLNPLPTGEAGGPARSSRTTGCSAAAADRLKSFRQPGPRSAAERRGAAVWLRSGDCTPGHTAPFRRQACSAAAYPAPEYGWTAVAAASGRFAPAPADPACERGWFRRCG